MGAQALAKIGRPTDFDERLGNVLIAMAKTHPGVTDKDLAELAGINIRTLYRWKLAHPNFAETLSHVKGLADDMMEEALFDLGMGGNVTAAIFWLKNRKPEQWRDAQRIELQNLSKPEPLPTPEEALRILNADYALLPAVPVVIEDL
jgi:hypothetical protein